MDYDIINQVYEEIISIINNYVRRTNCSYEIARKLSFTLLGYYLVMGPEVFSKINTVLDDLVIFEFQDKKAYSEKLNGIKGSEIETEYNPSLTWDYKFDEKNKFLGGIPYILYMQGDEFGDVLSLVHEFSHALEATGGEVLKEDDKFLYISQGFGIIKVRKETNAFSVERHGFSELVASSLETKVAKKLTVLDSDKLTNPLLKEFITSIKEFKGKNILARSYELLSAAFKDLMDNDEFFKLITKYFYANLEDAFMDEYNAFDKSLNYYILKNGAERLEDPDKEYAEAQYYTDRVRGQEAIFSKATNFTPDSRILILV